MAGVLAFSRNALLRDILARHPHVERVVVGGDAELEFESEQGRRRIWAGNPDVEVAGLVETMDNNPLVCADEASVPDAASTLALICLGPLIRAGVITDGPGVIFSFEPGLGPVHRFLEREGLQNRPTFGTSVQDFGGVLACTAMAPVAGIASASDLDSLFDEAYGRSFYVRRHEWSDWSADGVKGTPFAAFRLRLQPDDGAGLATVQAMASAHGKCGEAQIVHAFNVMSGFEESLGID